MSALCKRPRSGGQLLTGTGQKCLACLAQIVKKGRLKEYRMLYAPRMTPHRRSRVPFAHALPSTRRVRNLIACVLFLTAVLTSAQADLVLTLSPNLRKAGPGDEVTFTGKITNTTGMNLAANDMFLNFGGFDPAVFTDITHRLGTSDFVLPNFRFLENVNLFSVKISPAAQPGTYTMSVSLQDINDSLSAEVVAFVEVSQASQAPICRAGGPYLAECTGATTAIQLDATASTDPNGGHLTYMWNSDCAAASFDDPTNPKPTLRLVTSDGSNTCNVTLTLKNASGLSSTCSTTVTITDTTAPIINTVAAIPRALTPPNHKMVPVKLDVLASDNCGAATCKIISVSSNEPINGLGDGDKSPDWEITGDLTLNLRSERSGMGQGRVYSITVECSDMSGHSARKIVTVTVPHDQGGNKLASMTRSQSNR